jgi:hypothetical protein
LEHVLNGEVALDVGFLEGCEVVVVHLDGVLHNFFVVLEGESEEGIAINS